MIEKGIRIVDTDSAMKEEDATDLLSHSSPFMENEAQTRSTPPTWKGALSSAKSIPFGESSCLTKSSELGYDVQEPLHTSHWSCCSHFLHKNDC